MLQDQEIRTNLETNKVKTTTKTNAIQLRAFNQDRTRGLEPRRDAKLCAGNIF